ncbi:MAG: DnaJ domain-containing protein [Proteobacteria bacterium]|nr:DnaJ domain-containing protein [Pseudomonadota bacterium]
MPTHTCAWPQCREEGLFPAPKDPRDLKQRQYFCQPHIKEFNKRWNGLSGFSENEIYQMQDGAATWQRPTWGMGLGASGGTPTGARVENTFASADDLYGFFKNRVAQEGARPSSATRHLPPDVKEACAIFSIEQPLEEALLKKRYLSLVKTHHPDVNKSPDAPEHIKRINVAFRILADFAQRHAAA